MPTLADYRMRVLNTLKSTNAKFEDEVVDEAIRRVIDEYSQASPDIDSLSFPLQQGGSAQPLTGCLSLLAVQQLILPYQPTELDELAPVREDFYIFFRQALPYAYFTGLPLPQAGQLLFVRYARRHTLTGLDGATLTTLRSEHASMLVVGAAGAAATSRAAGIIEQWGGKNGDPNQLMLWGQSQYQKFREFLLTIRADQACFVFPRSFWPLDEQDGKSDW